MRKKRFLLTTCLALCVGITALAQSSGNEVKATGVVKDANGEPIVGAVVMLKGSSTQGTVTDLDGKFSIVVPENSNLEISYVGYQKQIQKVRNKSSFVITLEEDSQLLDELVVVGYTTQKKGLLTGSVVSMNVTENLKNLPSTSAGNLLVGKLAGVDVGSGNGIPGQNPSISIRTASSWNSQPVTYVIDGVVRESTDFYNLSANEIDNITVLKDAASAAIYGSRSAGGVVLVTTKRGNEGKPVFNYSFNYGIDTRTKNQDLTDAVQTGELYNRINGNSDPASWAWGQDELDYYKNINGGWGYDQLDAVWNNPTIQSHNFSVNGGSTKTKYFVGASYTKQQGFLKPMTYDRVNIRLNLTTQLANNLELYTGISLNDSKQGNNPSGDPYGQYAALLRWQPDQPVYTDSGKLIDYGWIGNVGATNNGAYGYNKSTGIRPSIVANLTYKLPFVEGLSAKVGYSKNWSYNRSEIFNKNYDMCVMKRTGSNGRIISTNDADIISTKKSTFVSKDYLQKNVSWNDDYQLNFQINYDRTFNDVHHLTGALVYERSETGGASVYGGRETFPVYLTDQFWAASNTRENTWGGGNADQKTGRASFIGQFVYSYANKYLASFSFREDGSMKFHPDERWGFFPAGTLGWVISEEEWFNTKEIEFLKIRGSVGLTGNDNVGGWQWQESYKSGAAAYFGKNPSKAAGITYGSIVNTKLTWEKALSYNFGADINLKSGINASFDYWFRKSYDILGARNASVPTSFSMSLPSENYGQINAQGIDLTVGYRKSINDFNFYGNLTMSYGWNKVIKKDYAENAQWIDIPEGKSTSYISGYVFDRIIKTQAELDQFVAENPNYVHRGFKPELGMMVYKDVSGPDGTPDGVINSYDRVMLKKSNFPIVYGLNIGGSWKGLSLDMMFNGKLNYDKSFQDLAGHVEWNRMWTEWYSNSWSPDYTEAENVKTWLPRRKSYNLWNTYGYDTSKYWLKDASFIRLKHLSLSYNLPKKLYKGVFDNVKVHFTGTNLFVLSGFDFYDPELSSGVDFPIMRTYSFGIDVTF